ncbi:hypothetical protein [Streptomyces sp. NPDC003247]|uniref:hypothetical protein n=1 Tax=Streptomyces sp. NPDC003247 TaxID=3364677 RepID=UPI0036B90738
MTDLRPAFGERPARQDAPGTPRSLPALPGQHRIGPPSEAVPLTPAEQAAFTDLVRRLDDGD